MPVFTPTNTKQSKVHYKEYIRTENKPDDTDSGNPEPGTSEPVNPSAPEAE